MNRDVGDVEVVRDVLGGDDVATSTVILDAIRDGLAWVHVFSAAVAIACIAAAATLWRLVRAGRPTAPGAAAP